MIYTIKNLNDGLNIMDDPSSERMGEGETVECLGVDLTVEGRLQTSKGNSSHDIGNNVPDGDIEWIEIVYLNGVRYVFCTTAGGLYANGLSIDTDVSGRFKCLPYGDNIYITNNVYSRRFDGTTCYRWGIKHPTAIPTITINDNIIKQIDTFTDITSYITNQDDCTVSAGTVGSELLTNGTFTGSAASWTVPAVPWSYNANAVDKDANGTDALEPNPAIAIVAGKNYRLSYVISNWTVGTVTPSLGGDTGTAVGANGTYVEYFTATATTNLKFTPTDTSRFTIDTVSLFEAFCHGTSPSVKFTVAADTRGHSYKDITVDCTTLADDSVSPDGDLVQAWIYVDNLENLAELRFIFDIKDKTFDNDMFMYSLPFSGADNLKFVPGLGALSELPQAEAVSPPVPTTTDTGLGLTDINISDSDTVDPTAVGFKKLITDASLHGLKGTSDAIDLSEQMQLFWRKSNASEFKSRTWRRLSVPKSYWTRYGNTANKGWDTIASVKIEVAASGGAVNVYIADLRIAGGGKLHGDYWFAYGWGRGGTIPIHYSAPAKAARGAMILSGPHKIERQPVAYGARTASADPQVDACIFYVLGGGLSDWWVYDVIGNNSTTSGIITKGEDDLTQRMVYLRNDPAPTGKDLVYYLDRIWMINDSTLMCSEIGEDGTVMVEGWPVRNGYIFSEKANLLKSLKVLNNQMILRSTSGEWRVAISDPTDYTSVSGIKISNKGLIGQDSILDMEDSHIFPSSGSLVTSNGNSTKDILLKVSSLMTKDYMENAVAVHQGTYGFFSFTLGTVKVDFYRGSPRLSYHNDLHYTTLEKDETTNVIYGLYGGTVYLFDNGYTLDGNNPLTLLVTTRSISPMKRVVWKRVSFYHNTGGNTWFVYGIVDGKEYGPKWFNSNQRTECRFDFTPTPGENFQLKFYGEYNSLGEIYYPIRVYGDGA